jgi:DNA-binding CsgD family transcriptional regulator
MQPKAQALDISESLQQFFAEALALPAELVRIQLAASRLCETVRGSSAGVFLVRDYPVAGLGGTLHQVSTGFGVSSSSSLARLASPRSLEEPFLGGLARLASRELPSNSGPHPALLAHRAELCPDEVWRDHPIVREWFEPADVGDCLASLSRLSKEHDLWLLVLINRPWRGPIFERAHLSLVDQMMRTLTQNVGVRLVREAAALGSASEAARIARLSSTQQRLLPMLINGLSEKHIARTLNRSPHTIHSHVRAIYALLGVNSRSELTSQYRQHIPEAAAR